MFDTNDPRKRFLTDGTNVKWCSLYGAWVEHFHAQHLVGVDTVAEDGASSDKGTIVVNIHTNNESMRKINKVYKEYANIDATLDEG